MGEIIDRFVHWLAVRRVWGRRCDHYEPGCAVCEHWAEHDELFG